MNDEKYYAIDETHAGKLLRVFASHDEFITFHGHLRDLGDYINMFSKVIRAWPDEDYEDDDRQRNLEDMAVNQIIGFTLFCRQNMELVSALVRAFDYKEISKEEAESRGFEGETRSQKYES